VISQTSNLPAADGATVRVRAWGQSASTESNESTLPATLKGALLKVFKFRLNSSDGG